MSESENPVVWLNGALVPGGSARIDPNDRGLTLGDGLFETIRAVAGAPRFVALHLARLREGAKLLDIEIAAGDTEILAAFSQTLAANKLTEAVLRLTLTRGSGPRGIAPPADAKPTLLITAAAFMEPPATVTAIICRSTRRNEFSPLAGIKSVNYLDNILARSEAVRNGAEDAILLNTQGNVAEATAANLFVLSDEKWLTPRVQDGALPGIFRGLALSQGVAFEARLTQADLRSAQSICLGNALGVRAVCSLDGSAVEMRSESIIALRAILTGEA